MQKRLLKFFNDKWMISFDWKYWAVQICYFHAFIHFLTANWKDDELNTAAALKLQIWSDTETEHTSQVYLLAELIEKHIFELANLFQFFSQKVCFMLTYSLEYM